MPDRLAYGPSVCLLVLGAIIVRLAVGTWGYSGESTPPKYGDYEAQRHWMEITIHLPPSQWYVNSTRNDLSWWGLDYPPLSGYQSWLCGKFVQFFEPEAVALTTSRGYESTSSRTLLRWTVLISDLLVFLPAALLVVRAFAPASSHSPRARVALLCAILMQPAAVVIDHGHFQYNCISLGLALAAAALIALGRPFLGSALYVLSMGHKHMALYFAPAFFAHLLGWCFQASSTVNALGRFVGLGVTVLGTLAAVFLPFLTSLEALLHVLTRLAPFNRGIFEDYVANFWCTSARLIKWGQVLDQPALLKLCLAATVTACLPPMLHQIQYPSPKGLLYCMATSALAFFLFSYQVHEKSILLALLPISALALEEPLLSTCFPLVAMFSMYPLLEKDRQQVPYVALMGIYVLLTDLTREGRTTEKGAEEGSAFGKARGLRLAYLAGTFFTCFDLHVLRQIVSPPARLPFLHDALFTATAFLHFAAYYVYLNVRMWTAPELCSTALRRGPTKLSSSTNPAPAAATGRVPVAATRLVGADSVAITRRNSKED